MKKTFFLFSCLLFIGQALSQSVINDVVRKSYVDSVTNVLRQEIKNSGGGGQPSIPDCEHGIDLKSVYGVSANGGEYNYYSQGVKRLTEIIYNSQGREVFRHITDPVTSDRIKISFNLRAGSYSLVVENADCKAVSNPQSFVIHEVPVDPKPPVINFYNPGVYKKEVGSILYEWIPTKYASVEVNNGKVRIVVPESKRSWDGTNTCKRFVLGGLYDKVLSTSDANKLLTDGIALPAGNYTFKVLYLNADNWDQVYSNKCKYFSYVYDCGKANSNSAQIEIVSLSIVDGNPINGLDPNLSRTSWILPYQITSGTLSLPENKAFGVTRYMANVPKDSLLSKVSHIQYIYSWVDNVSKSKAWRNQQGYGSDGSWQQYGSIDSKGNRIPDDIAEPQWHIDRAIIDKGYILMSEYAENYGNKRGCPPCYDKSEQIYKGIYGRYQRELGVTSPEQTWLGSDYFSPLYGGTISLSFQEERSSTLAEGLSSIQRARQRRYDGSWTSSDYFSRGWVDTRNMFTQGYLGHLWSQSGSPAFYSRLYNHEKANLALSNRRKIVYSTNAQEGLHEDKITISGAWYKAKFDEGELIRVDGVIHSYQTMLTDAFFSLLYGNAYIIWESNVVMNQDPYTFKWSWFGGFESIENDGWKTEWQPNGGVAKRYYPGVNGPPQIQSDGQFPEKPMVGDQGAWVGAKLYESVLGYIDKLVYPDFEYNGLLIVAIKGKQGALVSANGVQNEGQKNLVEIYEKKLPLLIEGTGPKGRVWIYQNPNAGIVEEQGIEVSGKFFKVIGDKLTIIKDE